MHIQGARGTGGFSSGSGYVARVILASVGFQWAVCVRELHVGFLSCAQSGCRWVHPESRSDLILTHGSFLPHVAPSILRLFFLSLPDALKLLSLTFLHLRSGQRDSLPIPSTSTMLESLECTYNNDFFNHHESLHKTPTLHAPKMQHNQRNTLSGFQFLCLEIIGHFSRCISCTSLSAKLSPLVSLAAAVSSMH